MTACRITPAPATPASPGWISELLLPLLPSSVDPCEAVARLREEPWSAHPRWLIALAGDAWVCGHTCEATHWYLAWWVRMLPWALTERDDASHADSYGYLEHWGLRLLERHLPDLDALAAQIDAIGDWHRSTPLFQGRPAAYSPRDWVFWNERAGETLENVAREVRWMAGLPDPKPALATLAHGLLAAPTAYRSERAPVQHQRA